MPTDKERLSLTSSDRFWLGLVAWLVLVPLYALKEYDDWNMYRCVIQACVVVGAIGLYRIYQRRKGHAVTTPRKRDWRQYMLYVFVALVLLTAIINPLSLVLLLGAIGGAEVLLHLRNYRQLGVFIAGSAGVMVTAVTFLS